METRTEPKQGPDPDAVPEHRVLRQRRLRDPGRVRDLLRHRAAGPVPVAGSDAGRPDRRAGRLRPRPSPGTVRAPPQPCADADAWSPVDRPGRVRQGQRLPDRPRPPPPGGEAHYAAPLFVDYVKEWFLSNPHFGETPQDRYDLLFEGGLKIVTTVDLRLQRAAERSIGSVLTEPGDPYGALTAIDPRTGYVRAMVGGRDYWNEDDDFARINLATGGVPGRQAGSAFKPFALVAVLEHGIPRTQPLNGSSAHILLQDGTYWEPHNAEGSGYGTISLESATVNSVNVAYANLLSLIGDGDPYAGAAALVE